MNLKGTHLDQQNGNYTEISFKGVQSNLLNDEKWLFVGEEIVLENIIHDAYYDKATFECHLVRTKWTVLEQRLSFAYSKKFKYQKFFDNA